MMSRDHITENKRQNDFFSFLNTFLGVSGFKCHSELMMNFIFSCRYIFN